MRSTKTAPAHSSLVTHFLLVQSNKPFSCSHQAHFHRRGADIQHCGDLRTGKAIVFIEPETDCVLGRQLFKDTLYNFPVGHTIFKNPAIIPTSLVERTATTSIALVAVRVEALRSRATRLRDNSRSYAAILIEQ